nr:hypothetical protein [Tanacetum cinerariifolium]
MGRSEYKTSKDSSLWAKVIMAIHGSDGKVDASMKAVRNGENIMFWEDTWNEGGKFKCRFSRMYALESCKSVTVGRKLAQSGLIDSFRRSTRGGTEQQQSNDLEDMVTATILAPMSERHVWSLESSGEFTVASIRKLIDDKWLQGTDNKTRWIKYVPIKINVLAWKVSDRIYMNDDQCYYYYYAPCCTSTYSFGEVSNSSIAVSSSDARATSFEKIKSSCHISSTQLLSQKIKSSPLRFGKMTTKAFSDSSYTTVLPGLRVDLRGKNAFIAGIADDNGYGWAIAKSLAAAGAECWFKW